MQGGKRRRRKVRRIRKHNVEVSVAAVGFWRAFSSGRHSNKDVNCYCPLCGRKSLRTIPITAIGQQTWVRAHGLQALHWERGSSTARTHTRGGSRESISIFSYICPLKFAREFLQRNRLRAQPRLCGCWYASTTYGDAGPSLPFCSGDSMPFAADFCAPTGVGTSFTCNILVYIISWYFYL